MSGSERYGIGDLSRLRPDTAQTSTHHSWRRTNSDLHECRQCNAPVPFHRVHRGRQKVSTIHRTAHILHSQYFLACGSMPSRLEDVSLSSHDIPLCCTFSRSSTNSISYYPVAMTTQIHRIHGQQDCSVDWPYNVFSQVMSPTPLLRSAVQMLLLCSYHQGEQVFAQCTILVKTPRQDSCLRK